MKMPPLLADFTHARPCKPFCEKYLTLPAFYEAYRMELTHYEAAGRYLDGVMNGRTSIPLKAWKAEQEKLTAERKELSRRYLALKDEVKEAERIRKGVYAILREENRKEQPTHKQDLDR